MKELLAQIRACTICQNELPHGVNPVVAAHPESKIAIIGQAPGRLVHASGIPWDDKSGENLRNWMGISEAEFYNTSKVAILPMGFCYPGTGKSGDLPPRPECAPQWHDKLWQYMPNIQLTLLIGQYAQKYYLKNKLKKSLTESVKYYREYLPDHFMLPHPSPRNNIWRAKNRWFETEVLPVLQEKVHQVMNP
ncbi:uracil-DNA glycosylase [Roseivirga pacifica]|uniref:Uracil-DNA glycosylase n=1 Tax=Roseivirga pacifica TaxID=1267423 RepID=A0A1I0RB22_9BACT|nr:uracil-DNA glycosylase family protein [Roseivirga pacifica]RKQ49302.1 uracil-DNA glycosylase [Roseivirga pacifica]SEW37795.1 Uracil-DNA glycosylase [Roseivirga pacifica]